MKLLTRLGLSLSDDQKLTEQLKTVEWSRLSLELERLERVDLVKNIKQNTLVTEGENKYFQKHLFPLHFCLVV